MVSIIKQEYKASIYYVLLFDMFIFISLHKFYVVDLYNKQFW